MTSEHPARRLWRAVEPIHAVTYFDAGCREAGEAVGLKGFWMTYFAFRAAPLGPVGPAPVEALFAGFHPARVARALPDAWSRASPSDCVAARSSSAARALRAVGVDGRACAAACQVLEPVAGGLAVTGRALGAANQALPLSDDPVERLWQLATTLREHRGDGHIAAVTAAGLTGLESNVLRASRDDAPIEDIQAARGWSADDWDAAARRLGRDGIGVEVLAEVEDRTDVAAWRGGLDALGPAGVDDVVAVLASTTAAAETLLRYPNPIGLPPGR